MKTAVIKRSIIINGKKTSISLENEFYEGLMEISTHENTPLSIMVEQIDDQRTTCNLSSAIRLFVLHYLRAHLNKRKSVTLLNGRRKPEIKRRALRALAR